MEPSQNTLKAWLFNPFHYIAGGRALAIGLPIMLAASLIGATRNIHFGGVLDLHYGPPAPVWIFISESLINWLVMGALLFFGGKLISRSAIRLLDVFGTQALARTPISIALLCLLLWSLPGFQVLLPGLAVFILGAILDLLLTIWMVLLMYRACAVSCKVSGGKAIGLFIVAIILGEILSKILIGALLSAT